MVALAHVVAVLISWLAFSAVTVASGYATRRTLCRAAGLPGSLAPCRADLWIGLGAIVGYLQVWSLFAGITWVTWIIPLTTVPLLVRTVWRVRESATERLGELRSRLVGIAVAAGAIVFVADRSLGKAEDYDLGLYHLQVIEFSTRYAAIPGLGNLHDRLAVSNPHLLLAAFLDTGPWNHLGYHLLNGWLLAALIVEVTARLLIRPSGRDSFATTLTALVPLALIPSVVGAWGYRVADPNLDAAAFILVVVGTLYLVDVFESAQAFLPLLAGGALIATVAAQRPLYWGWALAVGVVVGVGRRSVVLRGRRRWISAVVIPLLLGVGMAARQVVLSGYPAFPLTWARVAVDWAMPAASLRHYSDFVTWWARWPGKPEAATGWGWLGHWGSQRLDDLDVMPALLVLAIALTLRTSQGHRRRSEGFDRFAVLVVIAPAVVTLVLWFFTAPDPRFALPAIWLLALGALAWALPGARLPVPLSIGVGLVAAVMVVIVLGKVGMTAIRPVAPNDGGPLGIEPVRRPGLVAWNVPGLTLSHPDGTDQCWSEIACTAYDPSGLIRRGKTLADGYSRR